MLANCFSAAAVLEGFGTVGLLIAPLMAVGGLAEYFRSSYHAVVDQFRDRDTYQVAISRKAPSFAAFTKPRFAHTSAITVSSTGYVKEFIGVGCCIIIADWIPTVEPAA